MPEHRCVPAKMSDGSLSQHALCRDGERQHDSRALIFFAENLFVLSLDVLLPSKPAFDGVRTVYFKDNFMLDQVWRVESGRKKSRILKNNSKVLWLFFQ